VHILGCGSGRTGFGSARIPYVFAGARCSQGLECSSSPTSGTCFPCSGAWGPLKCVQISFCGPLWGPIFVGGGWSGGSFSWLGQRCCCLPLHGRERLELHDLQMS